MGANPADANNPLLSTPVATIAASLFKAALAKNEIPQDKIRALSEFCTAGAEMLVSKLQECGHLPPSKIETEEPKADDATLILQGIMLGVVRWESYGNADPRGTLSVGTPADGWQIQTKLKGGVPLVTPEMRGEMERIIAPLLRRL